MNCKKISIELKAKTRIAEYLEKEFKKIPEESATDFWATVWEFKNYPKRFGDDFEKIRSCALNAFISALDLSQYFIENAKKCYKDASNDFWKENYEEQREIALEVLRLVCKMEQCL